jgi:hypothetical protein
MALTNVMKELANGLRNFTKRSKQNGRNLSSVVAEKKYNKSRQKGGTKKLKTEIL